ncbi:MAG: 23S rRNA (adenine(2503)-C(2))-methyltransferase RlmN, partial [Candidatus Cloacimonetes bacterium]|nr:23S rRNA (adenine(2503)-C(2))-methyltransferase RlmN [Candidatus Cloacimonadota bacterium]
NIEAVQESKIDRTKKYLLVLEDGLKIESVLLFHEKRTTACLSSQVGCALGCKFCATGKSGFQRNLRLSEISGQVLAMEIESGAEIGNVVFMGMGEPLLNLEILKQAINNLNDPLLFNIGIRRISVSTAGIIPGIESLWEFEKDIVLSISLHSAEGKIRESLMPINSKYPVEELMQTVEKYIEKSGRRVTIEYILIKNVNDSDEDARKLHQMLKGLKVNVNLIPLNPVDDKYEAPSREKVDRFYSVLNSLGIETVVRFEKGSDIDGACGQLRVRNN